MRPLIVPSILALALSAACGDDGGGTGTGDGSSTGAASTSGGSATTDTSAGSTGMTSGGTTSATDDGTGSTGMATGQTEGTTTGATEGTTTGEETEGGTTTGGMASLDASMSSLMIFQDCMPIVPPDPVGVNFGLELTNTGDVPASASVVSATFFDAGGVEVGTIEVMPTELGPVGVGESTMTNMSKVVDSLMPPNGCGVVECFESYTLELALDVDGAEVLASDSAMVDCVF